MFYDKNRKKYIHILSNLLNRCQVINTYRMYARVSDNKWIVLSLYNWLFTFFFKTFFSSLSYWVWEYIFLKQKKWPNYSTYIQFSHQSTGRLRVPGCTHGHQGNMSKNKPNILIFHVVCKSKLRSVVRSSMHPWSANMVTIEMVMHYARTVHALTAGIKCRHCTCNSILDLPSISFILDVAQKSLSADVRMPTFSPWASSSPSSASFTMRFSCVYRLS